MKAVSPDELVYTTPSAAGTLTAMPVITGQFSFTVEGVDGYQYVVESSTNLTDWVSEGDQHGSVHFHGPHTPRCAAMFLSQRRFKPAANKRARPFMTVGEVCNCAVSALAVAGRAKQENEWR